MLVFYQEHKVSGGPLKSFALCTQARLSVAPVTQGIIDGEVQNEELSTVREDGKEGRNGKKGLQKEKKKGKGKNSEKD